MKKIIALLGFVYLITCSNIYGLSDNFIFVINRIGVPRYNVYKEEINEDIYNLYNVFVYGNPLLVDPSLQRWKSFHAGLWTYNGGKYVGVGQRGEYTILGKDYNGGYIYNYYFPLDRVPSLPPDKWNYIYTPGALESWQDIGKYKFIEQVQYMKEANFLFSDISKGQNNPYNQITYNINALSIGLNKARLESCATWKSRGTVYTSIIGETGFYGYAVFAVPPMAENAYVSGQIMANSEYTLEEDMDELIIPIKYKADVENTSKYATKEQVEEINTTLYINGEKCSSKSGSKIMSVGNTYMLVISRNEFPPNSTPYKIKIELESFVQTAFAADGLLQGKVAKDVEVLVREKYVEPINNSELRVLFKNNNNWVVRPLAQIYTENKGVTEAGKTIVVKLDLNVSSKEALNVCAYINSVRQELTIVESADKKSIAVIIQLPMNLDTTLYGYKSLREKTGSYFLIENDRIVKRCKQAHVLKICLIYKGRKSETILEFDTVDDYVSNINFDISSKTKSLKESINIFESWLNE